MLKVNGFYGHVMRNNFRSLWIFLGFAVALQIICGAIISLYLLFAEPTKMIFVNPLGYLIDYGLWVGIFGVVFFLGNLFLYKQNLEKDMDYKVIGNMANPRLHKIVQDLSITAGIEEPEIALIEADARNAFVCGLNESSSTLVVTRGLLKSLDDEELTAVIAHEITHIKNGDIRLMAFANVAMSSLTYLEKFNLLKIKGGKTVILIVLCPPLLILFFSAGLASGIAMTLSKVSRLLIASSREFIADAEAVRLTHNPSALISALRKIEGMSEIGGIDPIADAMMIDGATVGEFATHPTITERVGVLIKHSGSMAYDVRPRKDTRFGSHNAVTGQQPIFGLKSQTQKMQPQVVAAARTEQRANASMSVLERVNVGSNTNAFGVAPGAKKGLLFGVVGMFLLSTLGMWSAQQAFKGPTSNGNIPHISSELSGGGSQSVKGAQKKKSKVKGYKAQVKKPKKSGLVKEENATLPSYYVYMGHMRFDLVLVALITMAFFAYVLIVKSFQGKREREVEKYKLGDF